MNNTWLEQTRFQLEGIEVLQKAIVKSMFQKEENTKQAVIIDHKISHFINEIQNKAKNIQTLINDEDGIKKQQISIISGQKHFAQTDKTKGSNQWDNFYGKLRQIKQTHKKFNPIAQLPTNTLQYFNKTVFNPPNKEPEFSAEEGKGRYVDMHSLYIQHLNLYKILKQDDKFDDYLKYLQNFDKFHTIPVPAKMKNYSKYHSYLKLVIQYLDKYLKRVRPLINTEAVVSQFDVDFTNRFQKKQIPGWEEEQQLKDDNLVYCPDCLKVFVNQSLFLSHLNGKKHIHNASSQRELTKEQHDIQENKYKQQYREQHMEKQRELAKLQYKIGRLREQLATNVYDTMNLIRKKQTRGYQEQQSAEQSQSQSEVNPDQPIYNPKNLPLGWDGKPIPYWLYKLHGLGIEYKCQICGNYSYWGRRAFQMHFQEWRHTYGMKCLKIPNTIHFRDVTKIEDALILHKKLQQQAQDCQFRPDAQQQFEDKEGNVINRRTYFDMKKQGLLD